MKFTSLCFCMLLVVQFVLAQTDTLVTLSMSRCEEQTLDFSNQIAAIHDLQDPETFRILDQWLELCDYSEPAERLLVLKEIESGTFDEGRFADYLDEGVRRFRSRTREADSSDYREFYVKNAGWFCYLPLNSPYDLYTRELAEQLLLKQKTETTPFMLCVLLSGQTKWYNELTKSKAHKKSALNPNRKVAKPQVTFRTQPYTIAFYLGAWIPIDRLAEHFRVSPQAGVGMMFHGKKKMAYQIYVEGGFVLNRDSFFIRTNLGKTNTQSDGQFSLGMRAFRKFHTKKAQWLDLSGGLAYHALVTQEQKPIEFEEDTGGQYDLSTFDLNMGVDYLFGLKKGRGVGIGARYHFRPYTLDTILLSPLSWGSFSSGLTFHF